MSQEYQTSYPSVFAGWAKIEEAVEIKRECQNRNNKFFVVYSTTCGQIKN